MKLSIIVLTHNAESWANAQISGFRMAGIRPDQVLVIDSESKDETVRIFKGWGAEVVVIRQADFNHGGTRQLGVELRACSDILVFMTQDAIPADEFSITNLVRYFENPLIGVAYGRQLPRRDSGAIESHARLFNYPGSSEVVSLADKEARASKVIFCSDSFAAYRVDALRGVGGFPKDAFFAEDQIVTARMLRAGYSKAYVAEAPVYHSHSYSFSEDFRRCFDIGVFHARNQWLVKEFGRAEGEGARFVLSELRYLARHAPRRIVEAIFRTVLKYAGYRIGRAESHLSIAAKRKLSASAYYWKD